MPKESSWFGSYAPSEGDDDAHSVVAKTVIPMRLQPLYTENRIGLKTLDLRGDVAFETCKGPHMQLSDACWKPLFQKYVGGLIGTHSSPEYLLRVQ